MVRIINAALLDHRHIKSYASEKNLMKAIGRLADINEEYGDTVMPVRTPEGRWTAIVSLNKNVGGYVGRWDGFMTI